ncbi:MAG: hypothetical protein IJP70_03745 [Bacteroidales bacterium]|nr:hypothetical protein [Bacteroidales bacterium]
MKKFKLLAVLSVVMLMPASPLKAEDNEKVSFEVGADLVSSYIWRGQSCAGFSVQPSATFTWNKPGISVGAWASAELFQNSTFANMNEFDLSLSWSPIEALSVGLTDYHFCTGDYWSEWNFSGKASHFLELNLSYDFGPVAVAWNTNLTGDDYHANGDRCYSSYVEVSAPFTLAGVDCEAAVGATPWDDHFTNGAGQENFKVVNVSCKANKEIKGIPFFAQIVFNPHIESTYFVVGVSF